MADVLGFLLDNLLAVVIFTALFGVIISGFTAFNWGVVNIGGTNYNLYWVPLVIVFVIIAGVIYAIKNSVTKKK